jgi:uncharacterized membrane protein YtjA (UPF0391 family)
MFLMRWAITFALLALLATVLGFSGIAGVMAGFASI